MKISILCVGKIKEKFFRMAIDEYAKRLGRYCKLDFIDVADDMTPDNASDHKVEVFKEKEGERLLKNISRDAFVIALAIDGKQLSSEELASKIESLGIQGTSNIQLIIGGSLGLADRVLKEADMRLSFSKMTFPHQLMRVVLLEQIFRSYRIIQNEPYHKYADEIINI